jgi:ankyrin repeat protein
MDQKQLFRAVIDSIREGDRDKLRMILSSNEGAGNMVTPFGTVLHIAASEGRLEIVRMLVEDFGLDLNAGDSVSGGAPIHSAALEGRYDVVAYLLNRGATLDTSKPNRNPLFGAILGGNVEVAKLLIERGINKEICYSSDSMHNMNALAFAKERGASEFVALLAK